MLSRKEIIDIAALGAAVAVILVIILLPKKKVEVPLFDGTTLVGIIDLGRYADTSRALLTGYNYYLLEQYAASHGQEIDISLAEADGAGLDSLRAGAADFVVVPFKDSLVVDSVLMSVPVDSMSIWLMAQDRRSRIEDFNNWVDAYHNSEDFGETREMFLHVYSPYRSRQRKCLSPYDSLIRVHADTLGWDWRMLAAVIYQESGFHIEARSRRGACGLMQMMPVTADRFKISDPLEPNQNIMAGAHYLRFLEKKFRRYGDNRTERYKYTLAAYNAGEGRIIDCIKYAQFRGVDVSYWQNVVNIIPEMNSPEMKDLEFLRFGQFKGKETIDYVESVIGIYNNFCRICPE